MLRLFVLGQMSEQVAQSIGDCHQRGDCDNGLAKASVDVREALCSPRGGHCQRPGRRRGATGVQRDTSRARGWRIQQAASRGSSVCRTLVWSFAISDDCIDVSRACHIKPSTRSQTSCICPHKDTEVGRSAPLHTPGSVQEGAAGPSGQPLRTPLFPPIPLPCSSGPQASLPAS